MSIALLPVTLSMLCAGMAGIFLVLGVLGSLLPDDLSGALREGLTAFGRKLAAYRAPDAVLTGLETRTSSPVRLLRDKENLQCTGLAGLYPCGEGAGYAGGIMTAAVDGVRCAAELMKNWGPMAD